MQKSEISVHTHDSLVKSRYHSSMILSSMPEALKVSKECGSGRGSAAREGGRRSSHKGQIELPRGPHVTPAAEVPNPFF